MSDKSPDEAEKQTETGLKDTAGSEATIASPREQKTWHQSQEAHYIPEDESATHLALRPDQLNELKSQGLAEKFEIVGFEALGAEAAKGAKLFGPLENILENDKEIFAEIYALLRGRNTIRTQWLNFGFPKTIELVKKMLSHQSDTEKQ